MRVGAEGTFFTKYPFVSFLNCGPCEYISYFKKLHYQIQLPYFTGEETEAHIIKQWH